MNCHYKRSGTVALTTGKLVIFSGTTNIAAPLPQTLSAQAASIVEPAMTTDMTVYCNLNKIDVTQTIIDTFPTQPEE